MANAALQSKPKEQSFDTGIDRAGMDATADALATALADSFTLYLKTLGVHWNIVGPSFFGLHKLTKLSMRIWPSLSMRSRSAFARWVIWPRLPLAISSSAVSSRARPRSRAPRI